MRKMWVVAMREYRVNVRTKAFLISVFLAPVFMFGGIGVITFMKARGESGEKKLAVLDRTGEVFEVLQEAAHERNEHDIFDSESGRQREASYALVAITPSPDAAEAQLLELSDQVRAEKYFAFVEIDAGILDEGCSPDRPCIHYYTNQQVDRALPRWISSVVANHVKTARLARAGLDTSIVTRALQPVFREDLGLLSRSASGDIKAAEEADKLRIVLVPVVLLMFMFLGLMVTTQPLLQGVIEEKMQRIAEVVLGSIPPFQLMMGKLLGYVLVAVTLLSIYFTAGYLLANHFGKTDMVDLRLIVWFFSFLILGVFMFGSIFLAVGASCSDMKDAQSLMMPVMFPMMLPLFMLMPIIQAPNGVFATTISLIPIWSPMVMMMPMAMPVVVPFWQPPLAIAGCLAATLFCVWASGRIFRVGLLMSGKPPKIGDLVRWVARG